MPARPTVFILDPSIDVTGALMAARREAALMGNEAKFVLVLPRASRLRAADVPEFDDVIFLPSIPIRKSLFGLLTYAPALLAGGLALARALRRHGCTRLQVNDFYLMEGVVARLLGYRGRIVTWVRINPTTYGGALGPRWLRAAARVSDRIVAVSRFIADRVPPAMRAEVVYDPVSAAPPAPVSAAPSQRFVFVGNYIEGKGQDLAITAFHALARDFPLAALHFHGGDMGLDRNRAYRAGLEAQAKTGPGASAIHFHGFAADVAAALNGALAALNCSRAESFSLTCQEAGALGLPVIATRSGGPQEIIVDGETGLLVDVGDRAALEAAMRRLLTDPAEARFMGRRAATLVAQRFAPDRFRQQLRDLLDLPAVSPAEAEPAT
jgi:L-malate glycosyltransferase